MKNKALRYVTLVLLVFWMCVIFGFSSQTAEVSTVTSNKVIEKVVSVVYPDYDALDEPEKQQVITSFTLPVRKTAHFLEFAVLGALFFMFFSTFDGLFKKSRFGFSLAAGFVYAVIDEVHQSFISGRACRAMDLLIDFSGILLAVTVCFLFAFLRRRKKVEQ